MEYKQVKNKEEARKCDFLLSKLIDDEIKYNENIKDNYIVRDYFENLYDKDNCILFIAKDNDVVGYIFVKIIPNENSPLKNAEALIDGLYVLEEYRNQSIATNLIDMAKTWAKKKGAKYIYLNVLLENEIAKKLYYKMGFLDYSINLKQKL